MNATQERFQAVLLHCERLHLGDTDVRVCMPHPDPEADEAGWTVGLVDAPNVYEGEVCSTALSGVVGDSLDDALDQFLRYIENIQREKPGGRLVTRKPP